MMSLRQQKISSLIHESLSLIFLHKIQDPDLGLITITRIKVSPDIKIANVYLSIYEKEKRDYVLKHVESLKGFIRSELAKDLNLRHTPELKFFVDDTLDYVEKINELIKNIKDDNNKSD